MSAQEAREYLANKVSPELLERIDDETAVALAAQMATAEEAAEVTTTEAAAAEGRVPNTVVTQDEVDGIGAPMPKPEDGGVPEWVKVPADLSIPRGSFVSFLLFKAEWTMTPEKGDRHVIVWPLTDLDERVAAARIKDNYGHAMNELAKQTIRAFDGKKADWGAIRGKQGCVDDFLTEIGPKCRALLARWYTRTHQLNSDEVAYFLENCVAVRTMG